MSKRQYNGLTKYNYYRLKFDITPGGWRSNKPRVEIPAGTKMLYWFESSHSVQHLADTFRYVTTNPVGGPMVRWCIEAAVHTCRSLGRRERGRMVTRTVPRRFGGDSAVLDSEVRGAVARGVMG